jgi:subtilisin family serine protease/PKD repeat protein
MLKNTLLSLLPLFLIVQVSYSQVKGVFKLPTELSVEEYSQEYIMVKMKSGASQNKRVSSDVFSNGFTESSNLLFSENKKNTNSRARSNSTIQSNLYRLKIRNGNLEKAINYYLQQEEVEYAELIYNHSLLYEPNAEQEPLVSVHWGHSNANIYQAWDSLGFGDSSVVIGTIDTGVKKDHGALQKNRKFNYAERYGLPGIDDDGNGYVDDSLGYDFGNDDAVVENNFRHGTEVAGIASAGLNDSIFTFGVAPEVYFMPINILNLNSGFLIRGYEAAIYAAENGCKVINLSWGRVGNPSQAEQDIINYIVNELDVLVVAAAGNTNAKLDFYPASYQNVLSVAHLTQGNLIFKTYGNFVDIVAPGVSVYTTSIRGGAAISSRVTGSSYASPFVAGGAALLRGKFSEMSAKQIAELIRHSANPDILSLPQNSNKADGVGFGRFDLLKAASFKDSVSAVRLEDFEAISHYGIADISEGMTVSLNMNFQNQLAPTNDTFKITISTESNSVILYDTLAEVGRVANLEIKSVDKAFTFRIKSESTEQDTTILFKLTYHYPDRQDTEYFFLKYRNSERDFSFDSTQYLTVDANGRLGYGGERLNKEGDGFWVNGRELLTNGQIGMVIAQNETKISNSIYKNFQEKSNNFFVINAAEFVESNDSIQSVFASFSDSATHANSVGVKISQMVSGVRGDSSYLIVEYDIENTSSSGIDSLYVGLFSDFNIVANEEVGVFDSARNFVWSYSPNDTVFVGVKVLAEESNYGIFKMYDEANGLDVGDGFSDIEKYKALTGQFGRDSVEGDVAYMSSGLVRELGIGQSKKLHFAIINGNSLLDLQQTSDKLDGLFFSEKPIISDSIFCQVENLIIKPTNGTKFNFYADSELENLLATDSVYAISISDTAKTFFVTNVSKVLETEATEVRLYLPLPDVAFTMSDTIISTFEGDTLFLTTSSTNPLSWDFGNSESSTEQSPFVVYSDIGKYDITLTVTNDFCSNSETKQIEVFFENPLRSEMPIITDSIFCQADELIIKPTNGTKFNFYADVELENLLATDSVYAISISDTAKTFFVTNIDNVLESEVTEVRLYLPIPEVSFTMSDTIISIFEGDTLFLTTSSENSLSWDFGNEATSTEQNPFVVYSDTGKYDITLTTTNEFCSNSETKQVGVFYYHPLGVENALSERFGLQVFPNPATDKFNISFTSTNFETLRVQLFSLTGQLMQEKVISKIQSNSFSIPTINLKNGLYLLRLEIDGASQVERMMILR